MRLVIHDARFPVQESAQRVVHDALDELEIGSDAYWLNRARSKVKTIKIHHLVPGCHEVIDKLLLSVGTGINFRDGAQLRV